MLVFRRWFLGVDIRIGDRRMMLLCTVRIRLMHRRMEDTKRSWFSPVNEFVQLPIPIPYPVFGDWLNRHGWVEPFAASLTVFGAWDRMRD